MGALARGSAAWAAVRYGLEVVDEICAYREKSEAEPASALLDLSEAAPTIRLDIKYATQDNFTGRILYPSGQAFLRVPAAQALCAAQAEFNGLGLGIKIFDAYRPYSVTLQLWEVLQDDRYVAAPWTGSRHNRGCAVDLTLVDLATGEEVPMPTGYDDFSERAHLTYTGDLPATVRRNRRLLTDVMARHGFSPLPTEWWHFDSRDWEAYDIMDLSFEQLSGVHREL